MRLDGRALVYAFLTETALIVLAAFGGPHGTLGAIPWTLQLPGILVVLFGGDSRYFIPRVAVMFVVQLLIWWMVFSVVRSKKAVSAQGR